MLAKLFAGLSGLVGSAALLVGFYVIMGLYGGWCLSVLWNWFMAPAVGLPALTVVQGWGINITAALVLSKTTKGNVKSPGFWGSSLLTPIALVGMGYVVQRFFLGS